AEGNAPKHQKMLQNLLADRFKLTLRHEMREMPAYNLIVVNPGKSKLSADQSPDAPTVPPGPALVPTTYAPQTSIEAWAKAVIQATMGRPVIDKTGIKGVYDIRLEYPNPGLPPRDLNLAEGEWARQAVNRVQTVIRENFPSVIQEQLGLKLEPTTALVEILVIEHAEKPEN